VDFFAISAAPIRVAVVIDRIQSGVVGVIHVLVEELTARVGACPVVEVGW